MLCGSEVMHADEGGGVVLVLQLILKWSIVCLHTHMLLLYSVYGEEYNAGR